MEKNVKNILRIIGFLLIVVGLYLLGSDYKIGAYIAIIGAIMAGVTWWGLILALIGGFIEQIFHDNGF